MSRREEVVLYQLNICHSCRPHQQRRSVCAVYDKAPSVWTCPVVSLLVQQYSKTLSPSCKVLGNEKISIRRLFQFLRRCNLSKVSRCIYFCCFFTTVKVFWPVGPLYSFNFHCFCCNTNVRFNLLWRIVYRFNNCFILLTSFRIENNSHLCGAIITLKNVFAPKSEIFVVQL